MRRWFLSYHSADQALAERLAAAIERRDDGSSVFIAKKSLRAGGYWQKALADEIAQATAFVLLIGPSGIGPWQVPEYNEAHDRSVKDSSFPVVLVLTEGQTAPGLPFLRQFNWIITPDPTSEKDLARLIEAAAGAGSRPGELWRYTSPYRGLAAMKEEDSDFFFGRERETVEVLGALAAAPSTLSPGGPPSRQLPVLLGNSGVGKSSLAQAGVVAALKRQAWPERAGATSPWPHLFEGSRGWCFLKLNPGTEPLKALVETFLDTWQFGATDPKRVEQQNGWITLLRDDKATLTDLLDATGRRYQELEQPKPSAFFLYIDQGEELYARSEQRQRERFSQLVKQGLGDPRLIALMSIRSDFLGRLQNDEPLFAVHRKIDVPPLRESELREVVSLPAKLLSARFETEELPADIARRTAEESAKDAGALPLLSYLLDDMWTAMVARRDGVLRLPPAAMEVGGVLAERANSFLTRNPTAEQALRRVLTLKLATVRENGEPTRRRARRSEFSEQEWRLVSELADHPNRLLITAAPEEGETYAEVAHEAIFRRWEKLSGWIAAEREFLGWRGGLEADWRRWNAAPENSKNDALLMGLALAQAQSWLVKRAEDLTGAEREFIDRSLKREASERAQKERLRKRILQVGAVSLVLLAAVAVFAGIQWFEAEHQRGVALERAAEADRQKGEALRMERNAQQERDTALITQSRFLTDLANQRINGNEAGTGMLLALEALPDADDKRPFLPEAEIALFSGRQRLQEVRLYTGHSHIVWSAAFRRDGRRMVTTSYDSTARVWNVETGKTVVVLAGHTMGVTGAAFSRDGRRIVTSSYDSTARVWDAETGKSLAVFEGHTDGARTADFSPNGNRIVTASNDNTARIWDVETHKTLFVLKGHTNFVNSANYSPDGRTIVTAGDETVRIWDAETGAELAVLKGHTQYVSNARFSPDGKRIASTSDDTTARVWDVATGRQIAVLSGHTRRVRSAEFSPDGTRIATAADDKTWRLWNAANGQPLGPPVAHPDWVRTATFSPDGNSILTASDDKTARLWRIEPRKASWDSEIAKTITVLTGHAGAVWAAAFSADGRRVVTASADSTARLWDAATGKAIAVFEGHAKAVLGAALSADGSRLVTASEDTTARIWDVETRKVLAVLEGHGEAVTSVHFSPDGQRVVTSSDDKTARIWDAQSGKFLFALTGHGQAVSSAVFSANGLRVLTASDDLTARIWDAMSGKPITVIDGRWADYDKAIETAEFSGDGQRIVSAHAGVGVAIWDAGTGRNFVVIAGDVASAAFSPEGRRVVSTNGKDARIHEATNGRLNLTLAGHEGRLTRVAFSPDGHHVVTASEDSTARVWRVFPNTDDLVEEAKRAIPRCLTSVEREEAFLYRTPPAYCVELGKWPYDSQAWKDWLKYARENLDPPLPDTPEWEAWLAARKPK